MNPAIRIGIDLGGTKIEAAVLDDQGDFRFRERCLTDLVLAHGTR